MDKIKFLTVLLRERLYDIMGNKVHAFISALRELLWRNIKSNELDVSRRVSQG